MTIRDSGIGEVVKALARAETILVAAHRNPDGDTLGSMLGLGLGLEKTGKKVLFACPDPPPERLRFMPGMERVTHNMDKHADVAVAVDCGEASLLGGLAEPFLAMPVTVQVDHHELGKPFTTLAYIDLSAAAVGEMVCRLLGELGVAPDRDIATCLMVSLMEDTGGFRYPNVKASTMDIAGELLKAGADFPGLIEQLYWTRSAGDIRLAGRVVENVRFAGDGVVAWSSVTQEEITAYAADEKEVSEVVNDLRAIRGTRAAVLFRERGDVVRVNLRSRGACNVALVASRFGGGGHANAAGCTIEKGEAARAALLDALVAACRDEQK